MAGPMLAVLLARDSPGALVSLYCELRLKNVEAEF
jgi:hypothetical protein